MASGGGFAFLENVVVGALAATFGAFLPLAILIVLVAELHGRIKQKRIFQAMAPAFRADSSGWSQPSRSSSVSTGCQLANPAELRCQLRAGVVVQTERRLGDHGTVVFALVFIRA